ncbi:MAG: phosphatidylglycerophosphatase A [Phycisphaerae bacterium]
MMSGLGLGYAPAASGTFGSAGALAVTAAAWAILRLAGSACWAIHPIVLGLTLLASWGCVHWGPWACAYYADRARKDKDPGQVVLDEFAGQWLALIGLAMPDARRMLLVLTVQFVLFRLFDVLKPPPARQLEKLPFGWGILLDDLAAGAYANLVGQVVFRVILQP